MCACEEIRCVMRKNVGVSLQEELDPEVIRSLESSGENLESEMALRFVSFLYHAFADDKGWPCPRRFTFFLTWPSHQHGLRLHHRTSPNPQINPLRTMLPASTSPSLRQMPHRLLLLPTMSTAPLD